jgi:hypothetical protein
VNLQQFTHASGKAEIVALLRTRQYCYALQWIGIDLYLAKLFQREVIERDVSVVEGSCECDITIWAWKNCDG